MKKALKIDWFAVAAALGAVLLFLPMSSSGMPNTADGLLHLYRAALWHWAWGDGVIWPRWHTLLYHGYGYPVFNFVVPFPYIATSVLHILIPSFIGSFKAFIFIGCLNYALGMYFWARNHISRPGALLASIAYTFATYRFRELFVQGNYPQFFAWSLFPWVILSFELLASSPTKLNFFAAVVSYSTLALTHNISVMLFTPFLIAYVIWYTGANALWSNVKQVAIAFLGALGIAAGFWIPAMAETKYTMVHVLTKGFFDVSEHFLRIEEMFARSPLQDYRAANPPMPFNIGVVHAFLAMLGFASISLILFNGWRNAAREIWKDARMFSLVASAVALFMMLPPSLPVWKHVPFVAFAEFPTRFYGVAFLFSSFLVGYSIVWIETVFGDNKLKGVASITWSVACALTLITSVAVYQFPRQFIRLRITPSAFLSYETGFNAPGTTSASEYLTISASKAPKKPAISKDLVRTAFFDPPDGVNGKVTQWKAQSLKINYEAAHEAYVDVTQFYFPGWKAWVDGKRIGISKDYNNGLVKVKLPPGRHELTLRMTNTPIRKIAAFISLLALLITSYFGIKLKKNEGTKPITESEDISIRKFGYVPVLAISLVILLKVAYIGPYTGWFRLASPAGKAIPASNNCDIELGGKVKLIGYDVHPLVTKQGREIAVRLYWQPLGKIEKDYSSFVHLVAGPKKQTFAASDSLHPAYIPTSTWHPALYVVDDHILRIPKNAPPVAYRLLIGMYEVKTKNPLGDAELPSVIHVLPRKRIRARDVPNELRVSFEDGIILLGYELDEKEAVRLTLYWLPVKRPSKDYQVFVHLTNTEGKEISQYDGPPVNGFYPTSLWLPGHIVKDVHEIDIPQGVRPSLLKIGLYELKTLHRLQAHGATGKPIPGSAVSIPIEGR